MPAAAVLCRPNGKPNDPGRPDSAPKDLAGRVGVDSCTQIGDLDALGASRRPGPVCETLRRDQKSTRLRLSSWFLAKLREAGAVRDYHLLVHDNTSKNKKIRFFLFALKRPLFLRVIVFSCAFRSAECKSRRIPFVSQKL
jgi:hypothetical protein